MSAVDTSAYNFAKPVFTLRRAGGHIPTTSPAALERPQEAAALGNGRGKWTKEEFVTWSNFREVLKQMPGPQFDVKAATTEDWAAYEAALSGRQRQARRLRWVQSVIFVFSKLYDDEPERRAAHDFAWNHKVAIHRAFNVRRTKNEVIEELFEMYATCVCAHR